MNLRSPKTPNLQSGAIDRSAIPPAGSLNSGRLEEKGFCLACQYMFYAKRMKNGKTPRHGSGKTYGRNFLGKPDKNREGNPGKKPEWRQEKKPEKGKRIAASLWGYHAVREAWLNPARTVRGLYITETALRQFEDVIGQRKTPPSLIDKKDLDRLLPPGAVHQGIALHAEPLPEVFVQDLIVRSKNDDNALILMLDQVTDPHNVGAILRSACAFGAAGVIMQRRHSPELIGILAKTASGAIEHIPVAYEINLSDTLDRLRAEGFYAIGLDERGAQEIGTIRKGGKTVVVLGAEGAGLRPKVREHCDTLVRLPTRAPIASLNVSNAAAVTLYALAAN